MHLKNKSRKIILETDEFFIISQDVSRVIINIYNTRYKFKLSELWFVAFTSAEYTGFYKTSKSLDPLIKGIAGKKFSLHQLLKIICIATFKR